MSRMLVSCARKLRLGLPSIHRAAQLRLLQPQCLIERINAERKLLYSRSLCAPPSDEKKHTIDKGTTNPDADTGSPSVTRNDVDEKSANQDATDKKEIDLMEFSRLFEPEEGRRQQFPTDLLGNWRMHRMLRVSLLQRYLATKSLGYIKTYLDKQFDIEEFIAGAKMAYKVIRHVVANSRKADDLDLLDGIICPTLLQTMRDSISTASVTERNLGLEVHDIYCELLQPKIRLEAFEKIDVKNMSWQDAMEHRALTLQKGEWMQIKVRFLALENVFINAASGGRSSMKISMNPSTWTFQGKVWNVKTPSNEEEAQDMKFFPRVHNPELRWQLIAIEYW
eukprot:745764-Hanusia_phi.AAC.1